MFKVKNDTEITKIYGLIGAGGHGRETMPLIQNMLSLLSLKNFRLSFVIESKEIPLWINSYPIMMYNEFINFEGERHFNVAIGNSKVRQRIAEKCLKEGMKPFSIISSTTVILDSNEIGEGCILSPYSIITSNVKIGKFFHGNIFSSISHDCVIGDYVTFSPGVRCNGHVHIGNQVFIGAGAIIRNGTAENPLVIGEGAVIGMGAVVTKNVSAYTTVLGNPAKPIHKK